MGQEESLFGRPPAAVRLTKHWSHAGRHLKCDHDKDQEPHPDSALPLKQGIGPQLPDISCGKRHGDEPNQECENDDER